MREPNSGAEMTEDTVSTQEGQEGAEPSRRRSPLWFGVAVGVAVVMVVGGVLWWRAERSPAASIGRVAKAAVNGDVAAVEAAIDTTALISSAVDDMYNDPHFRQSYVASYTATHPSATPDGIKARLEKAVTEELREHVSSGTLPKRIPLPANSLKALVAQAYARHSIKSITIRGNYAYAVVVVPYHGKEYDVVVRLRRSGSDWIIDRIENLPEVLKAAGY